MKRSVERRLLEVEERQAARQRGARAFDPSAAALMGEAHSLLAALPDDLRADVEARGARGVAELVERFWELGAPFDDLPGAALSAYRFAFGGEG